MDSIFSASELQGLVCKRKGQWRKKQPFTLHPHGLSLLWACGPSAPLFLWQSWRLPMGDPHKLTVGPLKSGRPGCSWTDTSATSFSSFFFPSPQAWNGQSLRLQGREQRAETTPALHQLVSLLPQGGPTRQMAALVYILHLTRKGVNHPEQQHHLPPLLHARHCAFNCCQTKQGPFLVTLAVRLSLYYLCDPGQVALPLWLLDYLLSN